MLSQMSSSSSVEKSCVGIPEAMINRLQENTERQGESGQWAWLMQLYSSLTLVPRASSISNRLIPVPNRLRLALSSEGGKEKGVQTSLRALPRGMALSHPTLNPQKGRGVHPALLVLALSDKQSRYALGTYTA